jgi:hypothetical protein
MLVAGCSMLVEDPVFSGDKDFPIYSDWKYYQFVVRSFSKDYKSGKIPYFIPAKDGISASLQQVSRNQHPATCCQ